MAAWPVGLFWALDFVTQFSVSSLIHGRLGYAAILEGAFFTAIWGDMLPISLVFSFFRILFGGFWLSCYFYACTMVYMGRDRFTSGKYKRQGPLML
jgi:hypothetical protein